MPFTVITSKAQGRISAIKTILAAAAHWRAQVAEEHPEDIRNSFAAELLAHLARDTNVSEDSAAAIAACSNVTRAASEMAKIVGFSLFPVDLNDFLATVYAEGQAL
jgi:hypothetical protein